MSSNQANPARHEPAYTRQSVSELSSLRRLPVIMISRKRPLAASSTIGAPITRVTGLTDSGRPVLIAAGEQPRIDAMIDGDRRAPQEGQHQQPRRFRLHRSNHR